MANFAIYLGAAGLTVALFVGAVLLALDDNPVWPLFFKLGTYLGTWNVVWAVFRTCISRIVAGLAEDVSFVEGAIIVVISYVAAVRRIHSDYQGGRFMAASHSGRLALPGF